MAIEVSTDQFSSCPPKSRDVLPWDRQRDLMERSGQDLPEAVCLTPQTLLYFALKMEEMSETASGIYNAIHSSEALVLPVRDAAAFSNAADIVNGTVLALQMMAAQLRLLIKENFGQRQVRIPMSVERAVEIVDGGIDEAVVNAGFLLSMGVPAHECYEDVVLSNLSKCNPETGIIDREPDGKWIKGPDFKLPNLAAIIGPVLWKGQ